MIKLSELQAAIEETDPRPQELLDWWSDHDRAVIAISNAAPVLLAIARTALAYEQAKRSAAKVRRTYHESGLDSLLPGVEAADLDETNCRTAYLDALSKVSP